MDTEHWSNNTGTFTVQTQEQQPVEPSLGLNMYPGLLITGTVGQRYKIEYADKPLANNWQALATIVLMEPRQYYFDTTATPATQRFYRGVQVE